MAKPVGLDGWSPVMQEYNPLVAGSIDGTDEEPHDRGIVRAMNVTYRPNKGVTGEPECTIFVARLNLDTNDDTLREIFSRYGGIKKLRLVRDIVTGFSKGYAFVEYESDEAALSACRNANRLLVDGNTIFVDFEKERTMKGWVPRRLGGGLSGRKESGQLRFGGRDRPFKKPIVVPDHLKNYSYASNQSGVEPQKPVQEFKSSNRDRLLDHRDRNIHRIQFNQDERSPVRNRDRPSHGYRDRSRSPSRHTDRSSPGNRDRWEDQDVGRDRTREAVSAKETAASQVSERIGRY